MTAKLVDGKTIAQEVRDGVAAAVAKRIAAGKSKPTLATVLVGDRVDSVAYVKNKGKACEELGMGSVSHHLPADISQAELEKLIKSLNDDKTVNGILVQLPLPLHLNEERVLQLIEHRKGCRWFLANQHWAAGSKGTRTVVRPLHAEWLYLFAG